MSEEKEKALELKYAPGKCSHFIMGECMISKYNKSCGIDCDTCDTYYYYKQLKKAKEENEKLMEQLNTKYLEWEETFMENQNLTQQNKQMRENIGKAEDIARTYQDYRPCLLIKKELQQALKGVE